MKRSWLAALACRIVHRPRSRALRHPANPVSDPVAGADSANGVVELPDFRGRCESQAPQREESPVPVKPSAERVRRTCEFITTHRKQFPIEVMCRQLGVASSGDYQWVKCPQSARAMEDARLLLSNAGAHRRRATRPGRRRSRTSGCGKGGSTCLAVVIDLCSGKVVGWDAGPTIHHEHDSLGTPPTTNPEAPRLLSPRPPRCARAAGDRPLHFHTKPVQPSCDCHPDRRRGPAVSRAQPHG